MTLEETTIAISDVLSEMEKIIIGKRRVLEHALAAMLSGGHLLLEDVPGVGKTVLAKAFGLVTGCDFKRVQFTPDLVPSDITGSVIYNQGERSFEFQPGPVFTNILLADEINRSSPKTQSSLLECMEERQVSAEGRTYPMPSPFFVIGTQNPVEYEGTYPLPEAQLDRFQMCLSLGYPEADVEDAILRSQGGEAGFKTAKRVVGPEDIQSIGGYIHEITVSDAARAYILRLVRATRKEKDVYLGASPRGSISLYRSAQALAAISGRDYVLPDDIKAMAADVLSHRLILRPEVALHGIDGRRIIERLLEEIPVDGGDKG
ncbi:MAG: MoxR family ATPase [bacterium]|nr:MoxR family ATPase [bacterium]